MHDLDGAGTANDLTIDFTYNPASQIATRAASNNSYSWLGHFNEDVTDLLNGLNQPTMVGATSISHDARGNLTTDGVKIFTYDAQNRLVSTAAIVSLANPFLGDSPRADPIESIMPQALVVLALKHILHVDR